MLWLILLGYGVAMWLLSPRSHDAKGFYWGHDDGGREAGLWLLSGSILITWVFAKSVTNAANLGAAFGIVGGLAYAAYYLSIPVAGFTISAIRKRHGVRSLAEFLVRAYGREAALAFLVVICIRLFNEIWSNTAVVGSYFGEKGSLPYYLAAWIFTAFTLLYTLKGGLRSSLSSAGSTLDSTLSSFSKWGALDFARVFGEDSGNRRFGRMIMLALALLGNLPLFAGPSILKATTISGTMVMGLAPIFLFHFLPDVPRLSFHLAFWPGLLGGLLYAFGAVPASLAIGSGKYAGLLGINLYGLLACTGLYLLPVGMKALTVRQRQPLSAFQEVQR